MNKTDKNPHPSRTFMVVKGDSNQQVKPRCVAAVGVWGNDSREGSFSQVVVREDLTHSGVGVGPVDSWGKSIPRGAKAPRGGHWMCLVCSKNRKEAMGLGQCDSGEERNQGLDFGFDTKWDGRHWRVLAEG